LLAKSQARKLSQDRGLPGNSTKAAVPKPKNIPLAKSSLRGGSGARGAPAPAAPKGGTVSEDRIQNQRLALPTGPEDGTRNYRKLQEDFLKGGRTDSGRALEPPEDEEFMVDELMLGERPRELKNYVPLQSLIDALADDWRGNNIL